MPITVTEHEMDGAAPQLEENATGVRGDRVFDVTNGEDRVTEAVALYAPGVPAVGDPWPGVVPQLEGLRVVNRSTQRISGDHLRVIANYETPGFAQYDAGGQSIEEEEPGNAYSRFTSSTSSTTIAYDLDNNPIPPTELRYTRTGLDVVAYRSSQAFLGAFLAIVNTVNNNTIDLPRFEGLPGSPLQSYGPGECYAAGIRGYRVVRPGLLEVVYSIEVVPPGGTHLPRSPDQDENGNATGAPIERNTIESVEWSPANLWGVAP